MLCVPLLVAGVAATTFPPEVLQRLERLEQRVSLHAEENEQLREHNVQLKERIATLEKLFDELNGDSHTNVKPQTKDTAVRVGEHGEVRTSAGRRLSGRAPSFLAVKGWEFHEFPNGHTCPNLDSSTFRAVLPLDSSSSASWSPSPTVSSADVALGSVGDDWSVSETQRLPASFKIVHDDSCALDPVLTLQLNTTVAGSLQVQLDTTFVGSITVGGDTTVAGSIFVAGALLSAVPTWTDLVLESGFSSAADSDYATPAWALINGFVHLRGKVCCSPASASCSAANCADSGRIALLPAAIRSPASLSFIMSASDSPYFSRTGVSGSTHYLTIWTGNSVKSVILDGTIYSPV